MSRQFRLKLTSIQLESKSYGMYLTLPTRETITPEVIFTSLAEEYKGIYDLEIILTPRQALGYGENVPEGLKEKLAELGVTPEEYTQNIISMKGMEQTPNFDAILAKGRNLLPPNLLKVDELQVTTDDEN